MFDEDSIESAVHTLWQLAMAMASLKHIAGLAGEEVGKASTATGHGEDKIAPAVADANAHTLVDQEEETSDKSFVTEDNINNEEIKLAALISSLTITMVCQQKKRSDMVEICEPSMSETSENVNDKEVGSKLFDLVAFHHEADSSQYVQPIIKADNVIEEGELLKSVSEHFQGEEVYPTPKMFSKCSSSMVAHQVVVPENPSEYSELPMSMVSHMLIVNEENLENTNTSMKTHQFQELPVEESFYKQCPIVGKESQESQFLSSLCTHQLSIGETHLQSPEHSVSLSVHTVSSHLANSGVQYQAETGIISSMLPHQVSMEENCGDHTITNEITETFMNTECQAQAQDKKKADSSLIASLASHKIPLFVTGDMLDAPNCITSMAAHQDMSTIDKNTDCLVSMAAHMAGTDSDDDSTTHQDKGNPSNSERETIMEKNSSEKASDDPNDPVDVYKEMKCYTKDKKIRKETLSQNIESMANNCQNIRPEAEQSIDDKRCKLSKIDELSVLVENGIDEFGSKTKNRYYTNENNIAATETHIMNNFKGVQFESHIVIHQQMVEEDDEENLSSELKAEHSPELNGIGDNIIAASCTIEDNSPVIMSSCSHTLSMESDDMNNLGIDKKHQEEDYRDRIRQKHDMKSEEEEGKVKCKDIKTNMLSKKKERSKKSSAQVATFNGNTKKQSYKIRFKVKLGEDPSKSSGLKYLFECVGGQNLFRQQ